MSTETLPISPARFAEAIKDLSVASLHLKTLEIRNSLAHLAYSNAQLQPFADGTQTSHDGTPGQPDPDCVEAIRENEVVMGRMRGRIELIRAEVEGRGLSWTEFEGKDEVEDDEPGVVAPAPGATNGGGSAPLANGMNGHAADAGDDTSGDTTGTASSGRNPWTDGTFQTGVIRNGEVHMHAVPGQRSGSGTATATAAGSGQGTTSGGRLSDEELRRMLEVRLAEDGGDEEGGMHL